MPAYKKSRKLAKSKRRVKRGTKKMRKTRRMRGGVGEGVTAFDVAAYVGGQWYVLRRTGAAGATKLEVFPVGSVSEVRQLSDDRARYAAAQNRIFNKAARDNMAILIFAQRQGLLTSSLGLPAVGAEAGTNFGPNGITSKDKRLALAEYVRNDVAAFPQAAPVEGGVYLIGYDQSSVPPTFK
jgi:hypothetical protein